MPFLLSLSVSRAEVAVRVPVGDYSPHTMAILEMYRLPASRVAEACAVEKAMVKYVYGWPGRDADLGALSRDEFERGAMRAMASLMAIKLEHPWWYTRFCADASRRGADGSPAVPGPRSRGRKA